MIPDGRPELPPYPPAGGLAALGWVWDHVQIELVGGRVYAGGSGWSLEHRTIPNALAVLVLEGRSRWWIGDRTLTAGPGDLLLVPEGIPHAAEAPAASVHLLSVHFTARVLGAHCLLLVLGFPPLLEGGGYVESVRELVRLSTHRPAGWRQRGRALVTELLLRTVHEHPGAFQPLEVQEVRALRLLCPAFQLLEASEGRVRVEELAKAAACSPTHLRRLFRAGLGMSPKQYLLQRRLQRAAELLRTTDHTVQQVAERCGFESLSHFHRCFRAKFGCTPRTFRTRMAQPP